jgi:NCAIR mutase (PurE)-related protein
MNARIRRGLEVGIDAQRLLSLLQEVRAREVSPEEALDALRDLPYEDLGFAKLDHHRDLRTGFPEVVLGEGKTPSQVVEIAERLAARTDRLLITRAGPEVYEQIRRRLPEATYNELARAIVLKQGPTQETAPGVLIVTAGTADLPVAEEASVTAELMNAEVTRLNDVGVAGVHRVLENLEILKEAVTLVVVAGMEGALPSVIGGLVSAPVIAVPTSVGYGASFQGLAALLGMLNSCAPGVAVVNIDNGFGAGYLAATIARQTHGTGRAVPEMSRLAT